MEERLPRKLAAILYADVAGYSRLTGEDEDATHRTFSEYLDLIASTIESHRGRVMHYAGDAVLAQFTAVLDALSSAVGKKLDLDYEFMGEQEVKNIAEPVRAYRVAVKKGESAPSLMHAPVLELPDKHSIAVLPFMNNGP